MSSNGRITRSKGPADGVSLPLIMRPKNGTNMEAETEKNMATQHQADGQGDQLGNTVEQVSPFARPGSRTGASTAPANATEVPLASSNPFAQPGSRAGSAQLDSASTQPEPQAVRFPNASGSPVSSISSSMFPEDINTSGSWDLIDPRCDAEVADITGEQNQQPVDQPVNKVMTLHKPIQIKDYHKLIRLASTNTQELRTIRTSLSQTQWAEG